MAIKKSEIYRQIWATCDKLSGGVESARYKDYILTLLFCKSVCIIGGIRRIAEGKSIYARIATDQAA